MNDRYEVYDHETCRVVATFYYGIEPEYKAFFESLGFLVRPHQFNKVNLR